MKKPKTIKAYLQIIWEIEKMKPIQMKGYEKLSKEMKGEIEAISLQISNCINTNIDNNE